AHGGIPRGFASFEKLLEALRDGEIDEAVLPMENAVVGAITEALEPFAAFVSEGLELVAVALTSVPVRLSLAARPGTPLAAVKRAWSHPAALRQCTRRLAQMGIERVVCYDTAGAAQIVAHDPSTDAAGCPRRAAERHRMWVLGADAARLQALAPARDVQVISLGQPAAHAAKITPPKQGTEPVVKSLPHATARKAPTVVEVGPLRIGAGARAVIAGPCSVESAEQVMRIAREVASCGATALRGGIFKPRTNPYAFQGHG